MTAGPRHRNVVCSARCGYKNRRTGDSDEQVTRGGCPRCGAALQVTTPRPTRTSQAAVMPR